MTLPAVDTWDVRGIEGPKYTVGPHCAAPGCTHFADHAHHIVRRSQLSGDYAWIELHGKIRGNLTGLCVGHHNDVTGGIGGHKAAIRFQVADDLFWWCEVYEENGELDYLKVAPLAYQPPTPESLAARASGHAPESEHCPFCGQTRRRGAAASSGPRRARKRKTWTIKVPDDAEENGAEVLDTLVDDLAPLLNVDPTATGRYYIVVPTLWYAHQNKREFIEAIAGRG